MSSSLPQPLVSYPPPISAQPSSHSKGSFGPVLAVLAVITVVTTVACIIGRLCARRLCTPKPPMDHPQVMVKDDVEHAFRASIPAAKPTRHAGPRGEIKLKGNEMLGRDAMKKYPDIIGAKVDIKHHGPNFGAKPREG